jgi:ATPase subunit of ABC transporter with duplicated ATPase domains
MSNVKNDVNELRQKEISSTTPRLRSPSPRSSWFRLKSKPALKAPQDQLVYEDYLTILAQSTENAEKVSDAQPGSPNVITTPHLPLVEQLRAEYNEIVSRELDVLVPERPKLRVLIIGQNGVGKTTLCNKMLGIPVSEVSTKIDIWQRWDSTH